MMLSTMVARVLRTSLRFEDPQGNQPRKDFKNLKYFFLDIKSKELNFESLKKVIEEERNALWKCYLKEERIDG